MFDSKKIYFEANMFIFQNLNIKAKRTCTFDSLKIYFGAKRTCLC